MSDVRSELVHIVPVRLLRIAFPEVRRDQQAEPFGQQADVVHPERGVREIVRRAREVELLVVPVVRAAVRREVADIEAEMKRLADQGFRILNEKPKQGADNKLVCFLHPKSANSVLVELCQSIKE